MNLGVVMAPLSNDPLRDWPLGHFVALARLCASRLSAHVGFVGTPGQHEAVQAALGDAPVANLCGATGWDVLGELLAEAGCVVANNSGVAHLAASLGVPTVCVFAASHSPLEWMPLGPAVATLVKRTACAPCGIARIAECRFAHRCMTEIAPEAVFAEVQRLYRPGAAPSPSGRGPG